MTFMDQLREELRVTDAQIRQLLGYKDGELEELKFEEGLLFLNTWIPDEEQRRAVSYTKEYWGWWKLEWCKRDQDFLIFHLNKEVSPLLKAQHKIYHNGVDLARGRDTRSENLIESYSKELVPKLFKKMSETSLKKIAPPIVGYKQLMAKKFKYMTCLDERMERSFGKLVKGFVWFIYGDSSNGKTTLIYQIVEQLAKTERVLYLALEEAIRVSTQNAARRSLSEQCNKKVTWTNRLMTYEHLRQKLKGKRAPSVVVIDSIQYWDVKRYDQFEALVMEFPKVIFIINSHVKGKLPDGVVARKIRYDADIKTFVKGFLAFPQTRFEVDGVGGSTYIINEAKAKAFWKRKYRYQF